MMSNKNSNGISMQSLEQLTYTIIPDSHGQYDKISRVVEIYQPLTDKYVFLGDVIDGPDSARLIGLIRSLGDSALTIVGNHEWVCRNALETNEDEQLIDIWRKKVWPVYEDNMLQSYGLKRTRNWRTNSQSLREVMEENGDLEWLNSLPPYFEAEDFIAVHAGPDPEVAWSSQSAYLDTISSPSNRLRNEPKPMFDYKLAEISEISPDVETRPFITGHAHLSISKEQRITDRRIRLASKLRIDDPLFVVHNDNGSLYVDQHR